MRNLQKMGKRTYSPELVYEVACVIAGMSRDAMMRSDRDPVWAYTGRAAVSGVVTELCEVSQTELAVMSGIKRTTLLSQIRRFQKEWPVKLQRMWIEAVLTKVDERLRPEKA